MKMFDSLNKISVDILNSTKYPVLASNTLQKIQLQKKSRILNFSQISKSTRNTHTRPDSRFWIPDLKKILKKLFYFWFISPATTICDTHIKNFTLIKNLESLIFLKSPNQPENRIYILIQDYGFMI